MILVNKSRNSKQPARLKLSARWTPRRSAEGQIVAEGKLWDFIEMIAQSRREGKNRRDGATVSTRVVRLSDKVGHDLFLEAVSGAQDVDEEGEMKKNGRRRSMHMKAQL